MTRAEKAAIDAYPSNIGPVVHGAFINGYRQAEKDLALTAGDVGTILHLVRKMRSPNSDLIDLSAIAKAFNETRK